MERMRETYHITHPLPPFTITIIPLPDERDGGVGRHGQREVLENRRIGTRGVSERHALQCHMALQRPLFRRRCRCRGLAQRDGGLAVQQLKHARAGPDGLHPPVCWCAYVCGVVVMGVRSVSGAPTIQCHAIAFPLLPSHLLADQTAEHAEARRDVDRVEEEGGQRPRAHLPCFVKCICTKRHENTSPATPPHKNEPPAPPSHHVPSMTRRPPYQRTISMLIYARAPMPVCDVMCLISLPSVNRRPPPSFPSVPDTNRPLKPLDTPIVTDLP